MEIARLLDTESFRKANCSLHPWWLSGDVFRIFVIRDIFFQDNIFLGKTEMITSWEIVVSTWYNFLFLFILAQRIIFFDSNEFFLLQFFLSKRLEYFLVHFRLANFPPPPPVRGRGMRGSDAAYEKLICLFTSPLSGRRKGVGVRIFACVSKSGRCYRRHARSR